MYHKINNGLFVAMLSLASAQAYAVQVTDNLQLGGAIRARYDYIPTDNVENRLGFDAAALFASYNSDTWIGDIKYWFYGRYWPYQYTDKVGDISFAQNAWVGYKFDKDRHVEVGLNQIPFGLQPLFGNTFTETLGYLIGLEDTYELGAKYVEQNGDWNYQVGYYARPAWQGKGTSRDGVGYSNVIAKADDYVPDGSNNQERNVLVGRIAKNIELGDWKIEAGASLLTSTIENTDTNDNGRRNVFGLHSVAKTGQWTIQGLAARQQISARNPGNDDIISYGGYDASFNVATRANLYVGEVSYDIPGSWLEVNTVKLYANYSMLQKSGDDYKDSQRYIVGSSFYVGSHLYIAGEWLFGRNDPYVGGESFTDGLAAGGSNQWDNQFTMNIGYYF